MTQKRTDKVLDRTRDPIEIIAQLNPPESSDADNSSEPKRKGSFDWVWELAH